MDLKDAIRILKMHNAWRRDNTGELPMMQPKIIGEAIDVIINEWKKRNHESRTKSTNKRR